MVVYSFYIFDRHGASLDCTDLWHMWSLIDIAECIYKKQWLPTSTQPAGKTSRPSSQAYPNSGLPARSRLSAEDDAKLVFGTVFSLRNMVRKLGGEDDRSVHC